jgi:hypothetical protein
MFARQETPGVAPGGEIRIMGPLRPERFLMKSAKRPLQARTSRCTKCDSSFIEHEPAFVHCRYCGNLMRVAGASLLEQQLYELRSGLRVAS